MPKKVLDKTVEIIVVALMILMVVSVFMQVFFRYVIGKPLGWTEEIGSYTLVWITFLGSYLAFCRKKHMRIEMLFNRVSLSKQRVFLLIGNITVFIFALCMVIYGIEFASSFLNLRSPYLGIPAGYSYFVIPLTGALLIIGASEDIFNIIKNISKKEGVQ